MPDAKPPEDRGEMIYGALDMLILKAAIWTAPSDIPSARMWPGTPKSVR